MMQMNEIFEKYHKAEVFWVQEEPQNMGAWQYLNSFWRDSEIRIVSRRVSASPATGFKKVHDEQQDRLMELAFG